MNLISTFYKSFTDCFYPAFGVQGSSIEEDSLPFIKSIHLKSIIKSSPSSAKTLKNRVSFNEQVQFNSIPSIDPDQFEFFYYKASDLGMPSHLDERLKICKELLSLTDLDERNSQNYLQTQESLEWISIGIEHLLSSPNVTSKMQKDLNCAKECLGKFSLIANVTKLEVAEARFFRSLDKFELLKKFIESVDGINLLSTVESLNPHHREKLQKALISIKFCAIEGYQFCIELLNFPENNSQETLDFAEDFVAMVETQFPEVIG